uniref:Uncharacterized protein n=1 Tax=Dulem virus 36 TaxID=3145754 RepID=A0AAU8AZ56_9CAUD
MFRTKTIMLNTKVLDILIDVLKSKFSALIFMIVSEFTALKNIIVFAFPIAAIITKIDLKLFVVVWLVILFILSVLNDTCYRVRGVSKEQLPVYSRRLTIKDEYGISIQEDDQQEAVIYLSAVEDYLQKRGLLSIDR